MRILSLLFLFNLLSSPPYRVPSVFVSFPGPAGLSPLSRPPLPADSPPRYIPRMTKLSPIESEFATSEDAEAHDAWVRAKVEAALASSEPGIPHDQVMAEMQAIIDKHTPR